MSGGSETEYVSARHGGIDAWPDGDILHSLWEAQLAAVASVGPALPALARAAEAVAQGLGRGGRLCYVGAGTSARIAAQDAAELPPTFGWPADRILTLIAGGPKALLTSVEDAEDDGAAACHAVDSCELGHSDALIGVAASGSTKFTVAAVMRARGRGAITVGVASVGDAALLNACACPIHVPTGGEPIAGSTRLKAGTAQKVVLNLLSTLVMIRLGRVHDGLMVDMQPRNEKLRRRARDMLVRIAACAPDAADAALARSGGNVKRAALLLRGVTLAEAEALLARHDGHLRAALESLAP